MTVAVDSNTVAYLPLTTDLTDQCGNEWTAHEEAAVSDGALVLDGANDYLSTPIAPFNVGDAWTYECYLNFSSLPSSDYYAPYIFELYANNDNRMQMAAQFNGSSGLMGSTVINGTGTNAKNNFVPTVGTWYHAAFVRSGNTIYFFVAGNLIASAAVAGATPTFTYPLVVGAGYWNNALDGACYFPGKIKQVRISKTARYTEPFTPPTFGDESLARRRQVM
ncbi:MAG: LamG domain-containing protein [Anaeromusa sp.]|uniref:LamG domain-containing protein n=1 Tax=Anaeromusa sp. TaxID=1872520 RepID=UPI002B1F6DF6|nr:LamG domain-containing protein [Anaeromusa sp.]MEA4834956.1 LamG domain-containing protein [Anaeromusa sp.]